VTGAARLDGVTLAARRTGARMHARFEMVSNARGQNPDETTIAVHNRPLAEALGRTPIFRCGDFR
jgi:hypothetical protein